MGEAAGDGAVHCERHGPQSMAFVCRHLLGGSGLGFWYCHDGESGDWQAWCGDCDDLMMRTGHWTEEAEAVADIRVVCRKCYGNIRRRNRARRASPD